MNPSTEKVEVRLADSEPITRLLKATTELCRALREELAEPFTMTPLTRERLQAQLEAFETAIAELGNG